MANKVKLGGSFEATLADAIDLWSARCSEHLHQHGEDGSCVVGAGIMVEEPLRPGRETLPAPLDRCVGRVVRNPSGQLVWEASVQEVVQFLRDRGIEAHYVAGSMV